MKVFINGRQVLSGTHGKTTDTRQDRSRTSRQRMKFYDRPMPIDGGKTHSTPRQFDHGMVMARDERGKITLI